jgi:predicted glycosyltransferase
MNIWVDIANAPHVVFFKKFISEWESQGHNVIVTARDLSGSIELLKSNDIGFVEIGHHYGASKLQKIKGLFIRCLQLRKFLSDKSIDVAVSQSSFYSPLVAKSLGVQCVYTNDNEFAKGNILANIFASHIIYPESLEPLLGSSRFKSKFSYYPGTKEGIYLSQLALPEKITKESIGICIRPEPWTAQYHNRSDKVLVGLLEELSKKSLTTILPRDKKQSLFFKSLKLDNLRVLEKPLSLSDIYQQFDCFIGAGGSMSRELAFMGLPCLSMYQGKLLSVDKSLISVGVMAHSRGPTLEMINKLLSVDKNENSRSSGKLKKQGDKAREIINAAVLSHR